MRASAAAHGHGPLAPSAPRAGATGRQRTRASGWSFPRSAGQRAKGRPPTARGTGRGKAPAAYLVGT
eukprot:4530317-Alexandrium_andersonii.AAC.1